MRNFDDVMKQAESFAKIAPITVALREAAQKLAPQEQACVKPIAKLVLLALLDKQQRLKYSVEPPTFLIGQDESIMLLWENENMTIFLRAPVNGNYPIRLYSSGGDNSLSGEGWHSRVLLPSDEHTAIKILSENLCLGQDPTFGTKEERRFFNFVEPRFYGGAPHDFTNEHFPIESGIRSATPQFISFSRSMKTAEVKAALTERQLLPIMSTEMLALFNKQPWPRRTDLEHRVVALHTIWAKTPTETYVATVICHRKKNLHGGVTQYPPSIELVPDNTKWPKGTRFGAVPLDAALLSSKSIFG